MAIGHELGLRLFLEGVEVPVIGASVQIAPNVPSSASIQVIPTDHILTLLPRTVVHLFFYDFVENTYPIKPDPAKMSQQEARNRAYKLMFCGEVQGLAFTKTAGSRAAVLNCVDCSNYWDTTYQYNFKGSLFGGRKHAAFIGANTNLLTSPLGHGTGTFAALLSGKSVNFPQLRGLLAGIVRVLEAIGGAYYGDTTFRGANDFTSIAELRLKILQQMSAPEKDDSSAKLFRRKSFNNWIRRQTGGLGKLVTFRGVVQLLQKFIYHDIWPNPAPLFKGEETKRKTVVYGVDVSKDPALRQFVNIMSETYILALGSETILAEYSTPSSRQTTSADLFTPEAADNQTTAQSRLTADPVKQYQANMSQIRKNIQKLAAGTPKQLSATVQTVNAEFRKALKALGKNNMVVVDLQKIGDEARRRRAREALTYIGDALNDAVGSKIKKERQITDTKLPRLHAFLFHPDLWFAAPPRCNVIFPEMYSDMNWERNFLREVSRMELQTTNEVLGSHALFNGRYYAPNVKGMREGLRLSSRQFGRLILDHELVTGIIPMFERMTEANLFAMRARQVNHKGAKVKYAQRAVNFQYFKHRFASRQMRVTGRFNPWHVAGFPGIVIDKPMDAVALNVSGLEIKDQLKYLKIEPETGVDFTRSMILARLVPTQYIGTAVSISHALNQQGGNTAYSFGQARVHREDTEYLGVDKFVVNKKVGSSTRKGVYAVEPVAAPKKDGRGPHGRVTEIKDVTDTYKDRFIQHIGLVGKVQVGQPAGALQSQSTFTENTGAGGQTSATHYKAYEITETIDRRARLNVDMPIEEVVRPPWIWDGYSNLAIGETYMGMIGTNAVTDVEGYTQNDTLETFNQEDDILAVKASQEGKAQGTKDYDNDDINIEQYLRDDLKAQERPRKNKVEPAADNKTSSLGKKASVAAMLAIEQERTIENSIDYLVRVYSYVSQNNLDIGAFIRNYTWRPVATMPEILGTLDYFYDEDGEALSGEEGFHSKAFGDEEDLFGLVDPKVKKVLGLSVEKRQATAKKMDIRKRRFDHIIEYADAVRKRGLLG